MSNVTDLASRRGVKRAAGKPSTYDTLIAAAHVLLERDGPTAFTIRNLAEEAGVAPMTIYKRFVSKEGVVDRLVYDGFVMLGERIRHDGSTGSAIEQLRHSAQAYRSLATQRPTLYSVMYERAVAEFTPSPECLSAARSSLDAMVDAVREGQARGEIIDGDPVEIASRMWAVLHGLVTLELHQLGYVVDRDAHFRDTVETMLRGLMAPPKASRQRRVTSSATPRTTGSRMRPLRPVPPRA